VNGHLFIWQGGVLKTSRKCEEGCGVCIKDGGGKSNGGKRGELYRGEDGKGRQEKKKSGQSPMSTVKDGLERRCKELK